ncbi:MAG: BMP family lipoprotein [Treponemataceae bacterium]
MKIKFLGIIAFVLCVSFFSLSCSKSTEKSGKLTIRLITDATGTDDKSYNAAAWRGILDYYGDTWENQKNRGILYDVVTCQTQDMYIPTLKQVSDEGYDIICATGFTFADALAEVAALYPEQKYMIVDVDWIGMPNISEFIFAEEEGSYLVGAVTALQALEDNIENPHFGFIGGIPGPTITKFEVGFIQGVLSIIPEATFVDYYANDWGKPELAKTQAKNWYDSGVYAIFSAAGGTGGGTIAQAKEYRSQGKNVWAIGVDSDQYEDGIYSANQSAVLTSMIKKVETATKYMLKEIEENRFEGKVVRLDLKSNGVGYSVANAELKQGITEKVEEIKADILLGNITIYSTYAEALRANAVPEGLSARD